MKKIYNLKKEGTTLQEIAELCEVSKSTISRRLREYCEENGLEYPKNKAGRKRKNLQV